MQHATIYREEGRYAGWPANYGIWSWGDEIVVGFTVGYHKTVSGISGRHCGSRRVVRAVKNRPTVIAT